MANNSHLYSVYHNHYLRIIFYKYYIDGYGGSVKHHINGTGAGAGAYSVGS